ncbi:MAG: hypothetical protein WC635_08680 [Bacteriovorax sp.]
MRIKRFEPIQTFYLLFSIAVIARVVCDINLNRIGIHAGDVFPIRKINNSTAPYSVYILYIEFALACIGAFILNFQRIRTGAVFIVISYLMGLSQMFQNQKLLILIISVSILITPLSRKSFWSIWFLRYQLITIYFMTALHKIFFNFSNGNALGKTFEYLITVENNEFLKKLLVFFSQDIYLSFFSYLTLILEIIIPFILIKKPKPGIILVFALHFSFNLLLKDILPFSIAMFSLSILFLIDLRPAFPERLDQQLNPK